jgi:hypothetical protein
MGSEFNYALALYLRGLAKQETGDAAGGLAGITAAKAIDPNVSRRASRRPIEASIAGATHDG